MVREDPKEELGLPAKVCRELCQIGGTACSEEGGQEFQSWRTCACDSQCM